MSSAHICGAPVLSIPDRLTGEIVNYRETSSGVFERVTDPLILVAQRWRMKYAVRKLLGPQSRQAKCHRWRLPNRQIEVMRSLQHEQAFYAGLESCGSVWLCPLCAAKISERRVVELETALASAREKGLWVQLLTLTVPHGLGDDLKTIVDRLLISYTDQLLSNRSSRDLREALPWQGLIRALEVTFGSNGWHPHLHVLVFSRCILPLDLQREIWSAAWVKACVKAGLPEPHFVHGCTLQNGDAASKYVGKWGLAQEMAKAHLKRGRSKGATPWDLLRIVSGETWDDMPAIDSGHASYLWLQYAGVFKGRRQLVWSRGLKDFLSVDVRTDQELAEAEEDHAVSVYMITQEEWSWILAARAEVQVLSVARDCPEALHDFIGDLARSVDWLGVDPEDVAELEKRYGHRRGAFPPF